MKKDWALLRLLSFVKHSAAIQETGGFDLARFGKVLEEKWQPSIILKVSHDGKLVGYRCRMYRVVADI